MCLKRCLAYSKPVFNRSLFCSNLLANNANLCTIERTNIKSNVGYTMNELRPHLGVLMKLLLEPC